MLTTLTCEASEEKSLHYSKALPVYMCTVIIRNARYRELVSTLFDLMWGTGFGLSTVLYLG
jgi:hypothetical protein